MTPPRSPRRSRIRKRDEVGSPQPTAIGDFAAQWDGITKDWEITEDSSPAAIAASQRKDVGDACRRLGPDVAAISAATDLPEWNVRRRLAELGVAVPAKLEAAG